MWLFSTDMDIKIFNYRDTLDAFIKSLQNSTYEINYIG